MALGFDHQEPSPRFLGLREIGKEGGLVRHLMSHVNDGAEVNLPREIADPQSLGPHFADVQPVANARTQHQAVVVAEVVATR